MATEMMDFTYLDDPFSESEDVSFENPPDGTYQAKIDNVEVKTNKNDKVYLGFDCIITGPQCSGKHGFPKSYLPMPDDEPDKARNKANMLHHALKCIGIDPKRQGFKLSVFLNAQLSYLLDKPVWIKFSTKKDKNGNDRQNCEIVEAPKATAQNAPQGAPAGSPLQGEVLPAEASTGAAWDPFAEEG